MTRRWGGPWGRVFVSGGRRINSSRCSSVNEVVVMTGVDAVIVPATSVIRVVEVVTVVTVLVVFVLVVLNVVVLLLLLWKW